MESRSLSNYQIHEWCLYPLKFFPDRAAGNTLCFSWYLEVECYVYLLSILQERVCFQQGCKVILSWEDVLFDGRSLFHVGVYKVFLPRLENSDLSTATFLCIDTSSSPAGYGGTSINKLECTPGLFFEECCDWLRGVLSCGFNRLWGGLRNSLNLSRARFTLHACLLLSYHESTVFDPQDDGDSRKGYLLTTSISTLVNSSLVGYFLQLKMADATWERNVFLVLVIIFPVCRASWTSGLYSALLRPGSLDSSVLIIHFYKLCISGAEYRVTIKVGPFDRTIITDHTPLI